MWLELRYWWSIFMVCDEGSFACYLFLKAGLGAP